MSFFSCDEMTPPDPRKPLILSLFGLKFEGIIATKFWESQN
jgi:hypothetical protein